MTEDVFRAFKKSSVADYAVDLMKGRNISLEQALMEAEEEFDADLPDGLDTEYSFMMNLKKLLKPQMLKNLVHLIDSNFSNRFL